MPLNYEHLRPGDLILCYGWNAVGKMQAVVKGLSIATAGPIRLALGAVQKGRADCNHALIVGAPSVQEVHGVDNRTVSLDHGGRYSNIRFNKDGEVITVEYDKRDPDTFETTRVVKDITAACNGRLPNEVKPLHGGLKAIFSDPFRRTVQEPRLCHATNGGCTWHPLDGYFDRHEGSVGVYRLANEATGARLAEAAGRVATTWAREFHHGGQGPSQYSLRKAFNSAFRSSWYGPGAKERARKYRAARATDGGPASDKYWGLSGNKTDKKEWFCSMFVIACYQAATENDEQVQASIPLDARASTPMELDGYIRNSRLWTRVGALNM